MRRVIVSGGPALCVTASCYPGSKHVSTLGGFMSRSTGVFLVALVLCSVVLGGCAKSTAQEPAAAETGTFATAVAEADAAMAAGDAQAAFDLYIKALKMPDASDADGAIAERQEIAKHTYIARSILAKAGGGFEATPYITVVTDHSVAETETVEAKKQIVEFLRLQSRQMRTDIPGLRKTIEDEESYSVPRSAYMVNEMGELWTKEFTLLTGDFGAQTNDALKALLAAAAEENRVMDEKWVEDAVKHLDATLKQLDALDKKLDAIKI